MEKTAPEKAVLDCTEQRIPAFDTAIRHLLPGKTARENYRRNLLQTVESTPFIAPILLFSGIAYRKVPLSKITENISVSITH